METSAILLLITLLLLTIVFIARPFINNGPKKSKSEQKNANGDLAKRDHIHSSLLAEKERILSSIQELDFDNTLNKVPEEQYPTQRSELLLQAAVIMQKLEDLGFDQTADVQNGNNRGSIESTGYDDLEEMIAKRRGELKKTSTGFCPKCGKPVQENDRFCPKCGETTSELR